MRKEEECLHPQSCWNRALPQERVFVLLERDLALPATVRAWIAERLRLGLSETDSPEIIEAEAFVRAVVQETRAALRRALEGRAE